MTVEIIKPPKRQADWPGRRVRASREITTGMLVIPEGKTGTIEHVSGGIIRIKFDACKCCGVAGRLAWKRVIAPDLIQFIAEGIG